MGPHFTLRNYSLILLSIYVLCSNVKYIYLESCPVEINLYYAGCFIGVDILLRPFIDVHKCTRFARSPLSV